MEAGTLRLLRCPRCGGELDEQNDSLTCRACEGMFDVDDGIPLLFCPNDWDPDRPDVSTEMRAFYEETPFPNYDDFDSLSSLINKAKQGFFASLLDEQTPAGALILEAGCGTGQLSNFLSIANRTVFAADMCLNSMKLGQGFKRRHQLERVHFVQMNLFRPTFAPETFDLVISNGVLHHTSDPFLAFQTIAKLVRPGGHILIGLYHQYGRLFTDLRRLIFNLSGDRFRFMDSKLVSSDSDAKKRAWFMDQYKNPWESKHTIGEGIQWLSKVGFEFVKSIPRTIPFRPFVRGERLFEKEAPGNTIERTAVELGMAVSSSREGGFFIVIGRKPE